MKTIGFVDFYISEWHANKYPVWIQEASKKLGEEFVVKYAWAEQDVSPVDGKTTDEWCAEFGVQKCETLQELCEKADYIIVLVPSNPEKHLEYAKEVLKYKKNTYIDKTFAPDYATAKEIFSIAEQYGTKFFSTSALRFAEEIAGVENLRALIVSGGGSNLEEYIIHQIEMTVKTMGVGAELVKVEKQGKQCVCRIAYGDMRYATLNYSPTSPFTVAMEKQDGACIYTPVTSAFFPNLIEAILQFFKDGKAPFSKEETLEVMKIRESLIKSKSYDDGEWIFLVDTSSNSRFCC